MTDPPATTLHPTHADVTLTAADLDLLASALGTYASEYECVDPDDDIERARVLRTHLRTVRAAL